MVMLIKPLQGDTRPTAKLNDPTYYTAINI